MPDTNTSSTAQNTDEQDLDRAVGDVLSGEESDIPKSRREQAREEATDLLANTPSRGLDSAMQAAQQAGNRTREAQQDKERAQQLLEQATERFDHQRTVERLLRGVVRERSYLSETAAELASESGGSDTADEDGDEQ